MLIRTILGIAAATALTAASAFATDFRLMRAKIPFEFRAGMSTMAAGNYEIEAVRGTAAPMFVLRNLDTGTARAMIAPIAVSPSADRDPYMAKLDFLCAGTDCALYRILPGGYTGGWAVPRPKFKNEMGRALSPGQLRVATLVVPVR
jgi:hypothetical protein